MSFFRLFVPTTIFVGCIVAVAMWIFPVVTGQFAMTGAGFALAFHAINWQVVAAIAAIGGVIRFLSQFEFFRSFCGVWYWLEVFFKAWR